LLCDVLGYPAREAAGVLETTTAAVNSALQRARKAVPEIGGRRTLDAVGEAAQRDLVRRYMAAWEAQDVDSIVALLAEDAKYSMPPLAAWYEGHAGIRAFLVEGPMKHRWRFVPTQANGRPAFGTYMWDGARAAYVPAGLDLLVLRDARIAEVVSFLDADFSMFGLPMELAGSPR
jgi:RNA polymerase sigma-70 factor (ECF subfamily)